MQRHTLKFYWTASIWLALDNLGKNSGDSSIHFLPFASISLALQPQEKLLTLCAIVPPPLSQKNKTPLHPLFKVALV